VRSECLPRGCPIRNLLQNRLPHREFFRTSKVRHRPPIFLDLSRDTFAIPYRSLSPSRRYSPRSENRKNRDHHRTWGKNGIILHTCQTYLRSRTLCYDAVRVVPHITCLRSASACISCEQDAFACSHAAPNMNEPMMNVHAITVNAAILAI